MVGTDSMSEGLNLQTCARVVNFDLPWNFMRVEQRIGRVDRIGGRPSVEVTNLFYADTVEEDIYSYLPFATVSIGSPMWWETPNPCSPPPSPSSSGPPWAASMQPRPPVRSSPAPTSSSRHP